MTDSKALIVVKPSTDPVIAQKRKKLDSIERMASRFKRIDIKFLSIPSKGDQSLPAFAVLPFEEYKAGVLCNYDGNAQGYSWPCSSGVDSHNFVDVLKLSSNLFGAAAAAPTSQITDEALAIASDVGSEFDRIMVAWEANWAENAGDPLMIGEIDGVWFLLAKWDTTSLESYVASA